LPLGTFTVIVDDPSTRGRGSAAGSLNVNGETRTINVNLLPQGSLVVTVRNANDVPIAAAFVGVFEGGTGQSPSVTGTTDQNGQVIFERVLAGNFSVIANAGGLSGQATGVLAANT